MAIVTLSQVRTALVARVSTLPDLLQVHATVPDKIVPPCAVIQPAPGDFLMFSPTMGSDVVNYLMVVSIYVPAPVGTAADAQEALDPYLAPEGDYSVTAVLNGTLGGLVSSASCLFARNYRAETWDEGRYVAADFPVQVMT